MPANLTGIVTGGEASERLWCAHFSSGYNVADASSSLSGAESGATSYLSEAKQEDLCRQRWR
jgi:hypothetical protein